jgi:acyl-CoA synthetase (AMP-forming)/AMP-acid ligase II
VRQAPALEGLAAGVRIAASLPNCPELAACFLALTAQRPSEGGGCLSFAPLNPELSYGEAAFELADLPATAIIVLAGKTRSAAPAAEAAAALGIRIIELQPDAHICGLFTLHAVITQQPPDHPIAAPGPAVVAGDECAGMVGATGSSGQWAVAAAPTAASGRQAIALVMHTSGTTRRPKVVPLTHGQVSE